MGLLLAESVSGAVVRSGEAAARRIGAEVLQEGPASQASLAGHPVTVETTAGVEESRQAVHQAVDEVAGAMTAGMVIAHRILCFPVPELGEHLLHGFRPGALLAPPPEARHPLATPARPGGAVNLPHAVMQVAGLTAAVANLQESVEETEDGHDRGKQ